MMQAISGRLIEAVQADRRAAARWPPVRARANQTSSATKMPSTSTAAMSGLQPEVLQRPEEIDAAQEADEQRRIAERRQRAADIGDQEDEEDHDVHVVGAAGIGADQRPHQDHGGAGGADDAGDHGAEGEHGGVARTAVPPRLPVISRPPATV